MSPFTPEEQIWIEKLRSPSYNQAHLVDETNESGLKRLIAQLEQLEKSYPGGMLMYLNRSRELLSKSKDGANPYEGYTPTVPSGERLATGSPEFSDFEKLGLEKIHKLAFVLVAGGLGERLGYPDIKIGLPIETSTGMTYIEYYIRMILSCEKYAEKRTGKRPQLPLAIMTSDDTYDKTLNLLRSNGCFGLPVDQLTIMKQQKVPALIDNDARLATLPSDPFVIETKPHGHGDVHILLNQHGLPQKWIAAGLDWMLIFQDTNGLVSHAIVPMLGVSVKNNFVMNSLAVPRQPGEAVGAICKLEKEDGTELTINVEYNQLNPLLLSIGKGGDVADPTTHFSPFPGNTNTLIFNLHKYASTLQNSGGSVPDFVNPKYIDDTKTVFKAPTRLECLMQDFPRLLSTNDKVGITQLDRWLCFSTVKNNQIDASVKSKVGAPPESPFSGECDQYFANAKMLEIAGSLNACDVDIAPPISASFLDIKYQLGPRVVMYPSFAISLEQIRSRVQAGKLRISQRSTLILEGDVNIKGLDLDGALTLVAPAGNKLLVKNLTVRNEGWEMKALSEDEDVPPSIKVRGYKIEKHDETELVAV